MNPSTISPETLERILEPRLVELVGEASLCWIPMPYQAFDAEGAAAAAQRASHDLAARIAAEINTRLSEAA